MYPCILLVHSDYIVLSCVLLATKIQSHGVSSGILYLHNLGNFIQDSTISAQQGQNLL